VFLERDRHDLRRRVTVALELLVDHRVKSRAQLCDLFGPRLDLRRVGHVDDELDRVAEAGHRRVRLDRNLADRERMSQTRPGFDTDRSERLAARVCARCSTIEGELADVLGGGPQRGLDGRADALRARN
jgi:hypothetical protein